jgi:DNA-binding transcriptional MocR family regulator
MPASDVISFARGAPSLDIVDTEGLKAAATRAFERDPGGTTAYGTAVGYAPLREWIAHKHGVDISQVIVTNGSMQADAFLFETLVQAGDAVIVEKPTYDRTLLNLRGRQADVRPVSLETDGIDVRELESLLRDEGVRPTLAHIIPNFQNPAGYTLSRAKREGLLRLAAEFGFVIFEDDPYVAQSIVYEFCASGAIDQSIATVKSALAARVQRLTAALERELPEARFQAPEGGYFMWVELPEGTEIDRVFAEATQRGVAIVKGTDFLLEGGENTLRLAYSGVSEDQIDEGVRRLAEAVQAARQAAAV